MLLADSSQSAEGRTGPSLRAHPGNVRGMIVAFARRRVEEKLEESFDERWCVVISSIKTCSTVAATLAQAGCVRDLRLTLLAHLLLANQNVLSRRVVLCWNVMIFVVTEPCNASVKQGKEGGRVSGTSLGCETRC